MSDPYRPTENLNPGKIIGDSLRLLFQAPSTIGLAALIPMAFSGILQVALLGIESMDTATALSDPESYAANSADLNFAAIIVSIVIGLIAAAFLCGAVARAALDHIAHGQANFAAAMRAGIRYFLPVLLVTVIVGIIAYLAALLLVVPGLYVLGMWWLALPIIVEERRGAGALGRSAELTKDYRWPMVGLVLLYVLVYLAISIVATAAQVIFNVAGPIGLVLSAVLTVVIGAFAYALGIITAVFAYTRLREIKEGGGPALANIFT